MEQSKQEFDNKVYFQPSLFSDRSEISALRDDQSSLLAKLNNLRRGVFKRLDDVVKSIKELILRQDDHDAEIARLTARIEKLESFLNL